MCVEANGMRYRVGLDQWHADDTGIFWWKTENGEGGQTVAGGYTLLSVAWRRKAWEGYGFSDISERGMSGNGVCRHCKEAGRSFHNSQTHFNEVTFLLSGAERSKDIHPLQGDALEFPNHPTFLHKEGFNPNPKPLSPLQDRGLTQKTAETDGFFPFWYRGTTRWFFWRLAQKNLLPC